VGGPGRKRRVQKQNLEDRLGTLAAGVRKSSVMRAGSVTCARLLCVGRTAAQHMDTALSLESVPATWDTRDLIVVCVCPYLDANMESAVRVSSANARRVGQDHSAMWLSVRTRATRSMVPASNQMSAHAIQGTKEKTVPAVLNQRDVCMEHVHVQASAIVLRVGRVHYVILQYALKGAKEHAVSLVNAGVK